MRLDKIYDGLHAWATHSNGGIIPHEKVFFREQSSPAPLRPCIGMKILSGPQRTGSFDDLLPCGDGKFNLSGQRTMSIDVQVYGDVRERRGETFEVVANLHASLTSPNALEILRRSGIAVFTINSIVNASDIEESEYEDRYVFDIIIGIAENFEQKIEIIESVKEIEANIKTQK